jgi:hypothetical protein
MPQILYTLQFTGKAIPMNTAGTILKAHATAPSCTLTTVTGTDGVHSTVQPAPGGEATFESEVTFTGETSFQESGTITLGESSTSVIFQYGGPGVSGTECRAPGVPWCSHLEGGPWRGTVYGNNGVDHLKLCGESGRRGDGSPLWSAVCPAAAG